jgi:hypothetical protein
MKNLGFRKMCAWWVPISLTEEQITRRSEITLSYLESFKETRIEFLRYVMADNGNLLLHFTPLTRQAGR